MSNTSHYSVPKSGIPNKLGKAVDAALDALDSAVNSGSAPALVAPPTLATDPGSAGHIAYDASHIYVCVDTDTWVRAALATW